MPIGNVTTLDFSKTGVGTTVVNSGAVSAGSRVAGIEDLGFGRGHEEAVLRRALQACARARAYGISGSLSLGLVPKVFECVAGILRAILMSEAACHGFGAAIITVG